MTEKQAERLRQKIKRIKLDLAADKRRWGGFYDDSRGLRYLPPQYFIKLGDYAGGLRYFKWFNKTFPDDSGFLDFLFEWTIVLFKAGKIMEAEKKAFETYCCNTYVIEKYFGRPVIPLDKYERSNIDIPEFVNYFNYSIEQTELEDFSHWLDHHIRTDKFLTASRRFVDIHKQLKTEKNTETKVT